VKEQPLVALVDDDESMLNAMKDVVNAEGFSAVTFASAERFLRSKRLQNVSCLVTDMYLPAMTGLELHRHLVAANRLIPTVLISARPEERVREQALQANIVCYLAKPFRAEELVACIRQAMQQPGIA
jgi:FixJ family two-component response regulator